jgi:hypothetical protein
LYTPLAAVGHNFAPLLITKLSEAVGLVNELSATVLHGELLLVTLHPIILMGKTI